MDILDLIEQNANSLPEVTARGVTAAIRHIRRAEKHFNDARELQDRELLNDVVYRTNQAFEGMLKEAYRALLSKDPTKVSSYQIEEEFSEGGVLARRVRVLFANYRQDWRNPATHDHTMTFSDQEALIAIMSVSTFAAVLLDQITEVVSAKTEQEATRQERGVLSDELDSYENLSFRDQVISLVELFLDSRMRQREEMPSIREVEIIGRLAGFVSAMDEAIVVQEQAEHDNAQPDLLLRKEDEISLIEVVKGRRTRTLTIFARDRVDELLSCYQSSHAVVVFVPDSPDGDYYRDEIAGKSGRSIMVISPSRWDREY